MRAIDGVNLKELLNQARNNATKQIATQMVGYLRGLVIDEHNLRLKAERLHGEAEKAAEAASARAEQIERIRTGDWSAIELDELHDTKDKKGA